MRRGHRIAVGLFALTAACIVGAAALALHRAESTLRAHDLTWRTRRLGVGYVAWTDIEGSGFQATEARLRLQPQPRLAIEHVDVDLSRVDPAPVVLSPEGGDTAGFGPLSSVPVEIGDLGVRWGAEPLVSGLSGSLRPTVLLTGDGVTVDRREGAWHAHLERPLSWGPLTAHGRLDLTWRNEAVEASFQSDDAVVSHPLLASRPLPPRPLGGVLHFRPEDGALDLAARFGDVEATLTGRYDLRDRQYELHLSADQVPLTDVIALFGPAIPEARRASCRGTVGVSVDLSGPPLRWEAWPRAQDLHCEGVLVDVDGLRAGAVTWKATGPDGAPAIKRTGPGQPLWTPWPEARRVAEAMIAAEDIRFPTHPGYDLRAIKEVLDEAASGSGRLRGGSTLTQQLAKNLYLDGERTLARKLRELIYTLELESRLDKRHILQLYVNIVELGPDLHGVGPATHYYFARRPGSLTDREAAFLAALLPDPRGIHARTLAGHPPDARIDAILDNMQRAGMRTPAEIRRAKAARLVILPPPP